MAAPVNANINVFANTSQAMAQFRALQAQVAATNKSIAATSGTAVAQQAALNKALMDGANASRMWSARMVPMNTAVQQFSTALDKGKMSLGQYTRYAASQLPGMSRVFRREFEMMNRVATQNVRQMQTQYVTLGQSAKGAAQAMALTPTALNKHAAASAIAAQRQMMFNRMIDLGTTKLLNWGKNTQWAGRQLMVGFSIPLAMLGAVAAKTFKEIDKGSIAFKRVYGDLSTTTAEMERNLAAVKELGAEYTRYGLKLSDTIELAADVAATGAKNNDLLAATEQTLRLSTLGLMEYDEALEATIALQTAFGVSSEDLGSTIDFLNVVENETILTMQDMAAAIPRVAPVIKGLGGDVRDLAVLMTAMREGGVTAAEGANALKTGLGRLINPTKAARDVMEGFGISLTAMIQSNRGDLMGMINDFGTALASLDDFEQQQALEKVFGKRQYARLGALFKNIANDASQAQRTVELTNMSLEDLGAISERELEKIEEATSTKFAKAVEQLKVSIAPIGEQFMKALTPVISFITKIADKFNELPEGIKNAIAIGIAAIAGIGPIVLMTVGLIANGIANIGKLVQTMRKFFARLKGNTAAFEYLTQEEREAATAARNLSGATDGLTGKFLGQQKALERLIQLLGTYKGALASTAGAAPLAMGMGGAAAGAARAGARTTVAGPQARTTITGPGGLRMAKGGVVPGVGNKDTVPAMLTPGESIVTKEATQKYGPMIQAMNKGTIPGFNGGVVSAGTAAPQTSGRTQFQSQSALIAGHMTGAMMLPVKQELARVESNLAAYSKSYITYLRQLDASGQQFVRTYSNLVVLMTQELNEDMKNGQANIARVKAEIGNPAAQIELKRQLKLLGMQDDEIAQILNKYVMNLNAQLDAAQKRLGSGNLSAAQMDRVMQRAAVGAANRTFTDPTQRAMFARLVTTPTTYLPGEGKGRKTMQSPAASRANPEARSYTALRKSYGISAATKFSNAAIAAAGYTPQAMQATFAGMPAAAQQAVIATKGNLEKALPIFREHGLKAGVAYNEGLTSAVATGKPNVSQAVSKNRQAASPAPWAAPMGAQDGGAYGKGFSGAAAKEAAKIKQSIMGMSSGKPGGLPPAQQALAQGTRVRPQGFPASVYNPANNPAGLGLTGEARAMRGFAGAIESRTAVYKRAQAEEEAMLAEQKKLKVTDRRLSNVKQQTAVVLGEELTWLEKQSLSTQKLAQQRALNEAALKAEQEAQARLNGAKQRAAVMQETMNQRPARGGMLDRPLGALRRFAFPGGQDAALKNLGFNQFSGQVKTAGQLIVESAKNIKTRVAGSLRTLPNDIKLATSSLLKEAKAAGSVLKTDFKNLGRTIKTNMQVDLDNVKRTATKAAAAVGRLATAAGAAAKRMATGIGGFLSTVDKNGTSRMAKMGQASNGAVMGLMGLSMAASFAGGEVGEMAQKIMPVTMGLMGIQMLLPMLTNPIGLLIIAVTALVGSHIYFRKKIDDAAKAAAELGANIGGVANGMKILEEATGFKAPDREDSLFRFTPEDREAMAEFGSYFESEAGSKFIQELRDASSEERYEKVSRLLAQGIASGMDPEKAKSFGFAIAEATGDALLKSNIARDFANQIFQGGTRTLIDLEKERLAKAPEIDEFNFMRKQGESLVGYETRSLGEAFGRLSAAEKALDIGLGAVTGLLTLGTYTYTPMTNAEMASDELKNPAAGLGFALQTLNNMANAEAVLAEERRNGIITAEKYFERQKEIDDIQSQTADYIGRVFSTGADSGAMMQALEDQLSFAGFSDEQIGRISENFSPDALAQQFFQQDFSKLDSAQKEYVQEIFERTMSGLTPENISQRLKDIEGTWSNLAQEVVRAIASGVENVNIDDMFTELNLESWFRDTFGDTETGAARTGLDQSAAERQQFAAEQRVGRVRAEVSQKERDIAMAERAGEDTEALRNQLSYLTAELESAEQALIEASNNILQPSQRAAQAIASVEKEMISLYNLDKSQITAIVTEFGDREFFDDLMQTEEGVLRIARAYSLLGEYENINLEVVLKEDVDPTKIASALDKLNNYDFSKFEDQAAVIQNASMSQQDYLNVLIETGAESEMTTNQIVSGYDDIITKFAEMTKELKTTEAGDFEINTKLVTTLFGEDVENAKAIADSLDAAMPEGLDPIKAQILMSLAAADPVTAALLRNPKILNAVLSGKTTYKSQTTYAPGVGSMETDVSIPESLRPFANMMAAADGAALPYSGVDDDGIDDGGGGGGGGPTPLEELQQEILGNLAIYTNLSKVAKKYKGEKDAFEKTMEEAGYSGSLVARLRKQNLSEMMIAKILSRGAEFAQQMLKSIGKAKKLNKQLILGMAGEQISDLAQQRREDEARIKAAGRLRRENFSSERISDILSDPSVAETLAGLKVGSKAWKDYINELEAAEQAAQDAAYALDPVAAALDEIKEKSKDKITIQFELREAQFEQAFNEIDRLYKPEITGIESNITELEKQKSEVEEQIEAIQRLQQADQRRIRGLQRQITMLERQKDAIQDQIDDLQYQNELDQRRIDVLNREDELRKRVADSLNKELEIMSRQEEKIRQAYQRRIDALDKVAALNDYIIAQQRGQLGLAQAISTGDIYAATAAAQGMRQESAQFAQQQLRTGLETGADTAVAGLRTSEGLTREQAEARILDIEEQSYQTSLKTRDIQDQIYERNLQMLPLKDQMREIDEQIEDVRAQILAIEDVMYDRETQILDIEQNRLNPINDALQAERQKLDELTAQIEEKKNALTIDGLTYEQNRDALQILEDKWAVIEANAKATAAEGKQVSGLTQQWNAAISAVNKYFNAIKKEGGVSPATIPAMPQMDLEDLPKRKSAGGEVRTADRVNQANEIASQSQQNLADRQTERGEYDNFILEGGTLTLTQEAVEKGYGGIPASVFAENSPNKKYAGGLIKYAVGGMVNPLRYTSNEPPPARRYAGGSIAGNGSRDSVAAMLTPGEFVIRKAMVDKYGTPLFEAINQGAISMPRYNLPESGEMGVATNVNNMMTSINAPVYNNYDMKFAINGTNQSADEIANRVMFKMKQVQNQGLRGNRGY